MIKPKRKIFKVSEITPADYNPRKINVKQRAGLKKSLDRFGYLQDIIVNIRDGKNIIVGGHKRLKSMGLPGSESIECTIVDLSELEEKALNVALNNRHTSGEYDQEGLEKILSELKDGWEEFDELNFDDLADEFDFDFEEEEKPPGDGDKLPEIPEAPVIKKGDLIEMGGHRVLCGDSTIKEDVTKLMGNNKIDLIFTDPSYGVSYAAKNEFLNKKDKGNRIQVEIQNDHMTQEETGELWEKAFQTWAPFHNKYSSFYICSASQAGLLFLMMKTMGENLHPYRHEILWAKNNHVLGRSDYNYKHEPILYGWQHKHKFYGYGDQKFSVWNYNKPLKNDLHPTMKPVELIVNAVLNSTERNMVVADYFIGSGSTLIACEKTNRKCYGMELDEKYCQVIIQRWCDFTGKDEIKINGESVLWSEYVK